MSTPPGWFPNQTNKDEEVYWDGEKWTGDTRHVYRSTTDESAMPIDGDGSVEHSGAPIHTGTLAEPAAPVEEVPVATKNRKRRTLLWVSLAAVLLLLLSGGVTAAVIANNAHVEQVAELKAAAKKKADAERAAEAAAAAAAAKQVADDAKRAQRADTVTQVEASIKKMAEDDISKGIITGPVIGVTCNPVSGSTDDLTDTTTTFDCFVGNKDNGDGTQFGYFFNATVNWTSGQYTYGLGKSSG